MKKNDEQTDITGKDLEAYYRYHSVFYDLTRWSFLFGRRTLIDRLPELPSRPRIMEVGCGTGSNIRQLQSAFPNASIYGIDLSSDMLNKARKKVDESGQVVFIKAIYGTDSIEQKPFDLILLSYSLTLTGDCLENIVQQVHDDLIPSGYIAVVDFHQTPFKSFRKWMRFNNVEMDGTILPMLDQRFELNYKSIKKAYGGIWTYFQFIGQRSER